MTVRDEKSPRPRRKQAPRFLLEEIIGKEVRVARSSCKDLAGTQGRILDETKNTLLLQ
ncbi:MAG: ribonuclease P protein subunit, partial [Candidatus Norongarragalinales archaeon]